MKITPLFLIVLGILSLASGCSSSTNPQPEETMYFPPIGSSEWATTSAQELGWNTGNLDALNDFLVQENTKSFMVLVNGRIVIEKYYNGHAAKDTWQWNSAGKTLVANTTGIAEQQGLIRLDSKVSDFVGTQWTQTTVEQEGLIQVEHLLKMTSGLNDEKNLVVPANLTYVADAGSRWAYANVFQVLLEVITEASGQDFRTYFATQIENKIGMEGFWNYGPIFKIYHSDTRSMARYGLFALNKGKWEQEQIINANFFNNSIQSAQNINPAYGYMWWLNGKNEFMLPGSQDVYQGALVPNAPSDMYAAMGASEQRIYVVPSKNMVVIRMGIASNLGDSDFALSGFDNVLWEKINDVMN